MNSVGQPLILGGFLRRALHALSALPPVSVWRQKTPEIEKTALAARRALCALAYGFHQNAKAEELAARASDERSNPHARQLLLLSLLAWPYERRYMGHRADVTPEATEAWNKLQAYLEGLVLGGQDQALVVRDDIRRICEAAISGTCNSVEEASESKIEPSQPVVSPSATPELPGTAGVQSHSQQTTRSKTKGKNIDARMLKVFAENPESHGWSLREWAVHLDCAPSTVWDTKTWRERLKAAWATSAADAANRMDSTHTVPRGRRRKKSG